MKQRFQSMLFPGGKTRAMTFSYDDGVLQDKRLIEMFDKYGVKGTFNLNYGMFGRQTPAGAPFDTTVFYKEEVAEIYKNHEIGGHSYHHSNLPTAGEARAMWEIIENRRALEELPGRIIRMYAHPFGTHTKAIDEMLRLAGYVGARSVVSTHSFDIPEDFIMLDPTCHHGDPKLMELAEKFCTTSARDGRLFYVWGHAYEFDKDDNWDVMEKLLAYVTQYKEDIWFATNTEIIDYVMAYRRLVYSADSSRIYNPSAIPVFVGIPDRGHYKPTPIWRVVEIAPGETADTAED